MCQLRGCVPVIGDALRRKGDRRENALVPNICNAHTAALSKLLHAGHSGVDGAGQIGRFHAVEWGESNAERCAQQFEGRCDAFANIVCQMLFKALVVPAPAPPLANYLLHGTWSAKGDAWQHLFIHLVGGWRRN